MYCNLVVFEYSVLFVLQSQQSKLVQNKLFGELHKCHNSLVSTFFFAIVKKTVKNSTIWQLRKCQKTILFEIEKQKNVQKSQSDKYGTDKNVYFVWECLKKR